MRQQAIKIKNLLGVDKAISYLLLGRGISLISQPVTILFIGKYLSPVQQGFYFTFSNIISLSIFLELGLGTILTQFASHEFAYLNWQKGKLEGAGHSLNRLLSLGRKTFIWYTVMSACFAVIIIPVGINFFKGDHPEVHYVAPWIFLVFFSASNLILYAFTSVLEGCGKVSDVQLMKLVQSLLGNVCIWMLLLSGMGLFAAAALSTIQFVITLIWIRVKYWQFIHQIIAFDKGSQPQLSWKKEILPLQWKIGLSWISGYIIFQSINPMLFKYRGAIEAGQMGMSISLSNLATVIGMAWLTTKIPSYGSYINRNEINELKKVAKKNTIMAFSVALVCSLFLLLALNLLIIYLPAYKSRFLPAVSIAFLLAYSLINIIINSISSYARSFKQEPFMYSSVASAVITGLIIFICAYYFNAGILCVGLFLISLFFNLPVAVFIFSKFQRTLKNTVHA